MNIHSDRQLYIITHLQICSYTFSFNFRCNALVTTAHVGPFTTESRACYQPAISQWVQSWHTAWLHRENGLREWGGLLRIRYVTGTFNKDSRVWIQSKYSILPVKEFPLLWSSYGCILPRIGIILIKLIWNIHEARHNINGLVQERSNSIANALELRHSCTKLWIYRCPVLTKWLPMWCEHSYRIILLQLWEFLN